MKKYLFTCLILLTGILSTHAQSNYRSGYIITNEGDTLTGWVDYRTEAINAVVCKFKPNLADAERVIYPGQIAGYRFADGGKYYISKEITIKESRRTVFLEYLAQGIMNLYFYEDEDDDDEANNTCYYFFEDKNGKMTAVSKKQDELVEDKEGITRKVVDNGYKGMINYLFREYEPVKEGTLRIKYTHKSMLDLLKGYQNQVCTTGQECYVFETKPDKLYAKTTFSVYGGMGCSDIYQSFENYYKQIPFYSPIIGAKASFSIPRRSNSWSMQLELTLNKQHFESDNVYTGTPTRLYFSNLDPNSYYLDRITYSYDAFVMNINCGFRYTCPTGVIRPSIEIGKALYFIDNEKVESKVYYHDASPHSIKEKTEDDHFKPLGDVTYIAAGLNFYLNQDHFLFLDFFKLKGNDTPWQMKLGYTF